MPVKTVRFYTFALIIFDILAILAAFTLAYILRVQLDSRPLVTQISARDFFMTFVALLPFFLLTFWSLGLYSPAVYQKRLTEFGKLIIGSFISILLIIGYSYLIDEPIFPARLVPVYAGVGTLVLLLLGREVLRLIRDLLYYAGVGVQRVMVVGSSPATIDIVENLNRSGTSGYKVVAVISHLKPESKAVKHFRSINEGIKSLNELHVDTVIQTELYEDTAQNQKIMSATQERHIQYCFIPGEAEFYSGKNQIDVFLGYPVIKVYQTPLVGWGEVVKRVFDLVITILFLPIWGTLFILVCIFQAIFNPGPLFYTSPRLTRFSKPFGLLKFRSMGKQYGGKDAAEEFRDMGRDDLAREYEFYRKVDNDPRITRFGKFIRATSLDELPQLLNVLKGDVSLVGPRPILPQELHLYKGRGALLHSVKSGLTGLWQVSGRSNLTFDKRVELELYYAQNWSFWLDIKILFKTIGVLFFRTGAK